MNIGNCLTDMVKGTAMRNVFSSVHLTVGFNITILVRMRLMRLNIPIYFELID